jgi:hypothetical protein
LFEGKKLVLDRHMSRQLTRQLAQMERIAEITKASMDEIAEVHSYAEYKVITTLTAVRLLEQAANGSALASAEEAAAREALRLAFLQRIYEVTEAADEKILEIADQAVLADDPGALERLIEWLRTH